MTVDPMTLGLQKGVRKNILIFIVQEQVKDKVSFQVEKIIFLRCILFSIMRFYSYLIILSEMKEEVIRSHIARISINFDLTIINRVIEFLRAYYSKNPVENPIYEVAAATAIICETVLMPTVSSNMMASSGIRIENVMRNLGSLSKEEFLNTLKVIAEKSHSQNPFLLEKISKINISFRIFKKYRQIFIQLGKMVNLDDHMVGELASLYWIIFLLNKKFMKAMDDINESTLILCILLQQVFCKKFAQMDLENFMSVIKSENYFPYAKRADQAHKNQVINYTSHLIKELEGNRGEENYFSRDRVIQKREMMIRFIDDLNEIYVQELKTLAPNRFIDEITFLELNRDLTPLVSISQHKNNVVSKRLNFFSEDSDQQSQQDRENSSRQSSIVEYYESSSKQYEGPASSKLSSPEYPHFGKLSKNMNSRNIIIDQKENNKMVIPYTPVSKLMGKSLWINQFQQQVNIQQFEESIRRLLGQNFFQQVKEKVGQKVKQQICGMTKHSDSWELQRDTIWRLYLGIFEFVKQKENNICLQLLIYPLACLCGCLYNHILRNINISLERYCKIYDVNIFHLLMIIHRVQSLELPNLIQEYLLDLEKQILIKQIWQNNEGYQFIIKKNTQFEENQEQNKIFKRLQMLVYLRIKQVCQFIQHSSSFVEEVDTLMNKILYIKPFLLQRNLLDQIIICTILAVLSQNPHKNQRTIKSIFTKYGQNILYPHPGSPASVIERGQEKMTLCCFYNQVFLLEIYNIAEDSIKQVQSPYKELKQDDFLRTISKFGNPDLPPVSKFINDCTPFSFKTEPISFKKSDNSHMKLNKRVKGLFKSSSQEEGQKPSESKEKAENFRNHNKSKKQEYLE